MKITRLLVLLRLCAKHSLVFFQLAKKYYFLTNEWTVFDHVTALGQSSETISTIDSVSRYPAQILTRFICDFHHGQDAGHFGEAVE